MSGFKEFCHVILIRVKIQTMNKWNAVIYFIAWDSVAEVSWHCKYINKAYSFRYCLYKWNLQLQREMSYCLRTVHIGQL